MQFKSIKMLGLMVVFVMFGALVSVAAADNKYEEKGPFVLTAETTGATDTLTFVITEDFSDDNVKMEIKLDIEEAQGDWELELVGPNGEDLGELVSDGGEGDDDDDNEGDDEFKLEVKGEVEAGEYVFTFTNTGTGLAQILGEYSIEVKGNDGDDRYFFDPGARVALYIVNVQNTFVINIWGIDANGAGYEAISLSYDELIEIIIDRLDLNVDTNDDDGDDDNDSDDDGGSIVIDLDEIVIPQNILLTTSEDGKVQIYLLTTGEFQVMVGPFEDGTVQVFIYDNFPPTRVYRRDFNVYTVIANLQAQGSDEDEEGDDD